MKKTSINVAAKHYDEQTACERLYESINEALYDANAEEINEESIQVIVNGKNHAFYLGGPQVAGVIAMIQNICDENSYQYPWPAGMDMKEEFNIMDSEEKVYKPEKLAETIHGMLNAYLNGIMVRHNITTGDIDPFQSELLDQSVNVVAKILTNVLEQNRGGL